MKKINLVFLILYYSVLGQGVKKLPDNSKNAEIHIEGHNNVTFQVQGNNNTVIYNQRNKKKRQEHIRKISKIAENDPHKSHQGFFSVEDFINKYNSVVTENEKLKAEIIALQQERKDPGFIAVLKNARKELEEFNNDAYQKLLEDFKIKNRIKITGILEENAMIAYLQATNNYNTYNYSNALLQINEALDYDNGNTKYLFLKAEINAGLSNYVESIVGYQQIIRSNADDTLKFNSYNNIGLVYYKKSNYIQAMEYYKKALVISENVFGNENTKTATIYNNIGGIYKETSDYTQALVYFEKSLAIWEKVYGKEHPITATGYHSIGVVYTAKGEYKKALNYLRKAFAVWEQQLGVTHPNTSSSYLNIGTIYQLTSSYDTALIYFIKALFIREKIYGKKDPNTAIVYNSIGAAYSTMNKHSIAIAYFEKALAIWESLLGKEHINIAIVYNNIGSEYYNKKNYSEAIKYFRNALAINEKLLGKEHPSTGISYNNIASLFLDTRVYDSAMEYNRKSLAICENKFGKESSQVASSYNNIGTVYHEEGEYDKALEYFEKSSSIWERVWGKEHPNTITSYHNIGLLYISKGDEVNGLYFLSKTSFSKLLDRDKSNHLNICGALKFKNHKYKESLNYFFIAVKFLEKSNSPKTDTLWASTYHNTAKSYCFNGEKEKALPLFQKALLLCKSIKESGIYINKIRRDYIECQVK